MRTGVLAIAIGMMPVAAQAQAYQCSLPQRVTVPEVRSEAPRRLPVTGYTLALSWAPEYCRFRENNRRDARQCSGDSGRFGFVVHGLWPDSGGSWPQWCGGQEMRAKELRENLCISPDAHLVVRQWKKHGTCMVRRPETYLKVTRILYNGLRWPDFVRISREDDLTVGTIRQRFADPNPGWFPQAVGVVLDERGWLEELRLCYNKRFMPAACDRRRFGPSDKAAAKIWRGL